MSESRADRRTLRITYIITRADTVGGAQIHVRDFAQRLIYAGHQAHVITGPRGPYSEQLEALSIPTTAIDTLRNPIRPGQDWKAVKAVGRFLNEFQPDLVSTHSSKAGIVGRIACRRAHVPCLFTAHGWAFTTGVSEPKRVLYRAIERMAAPLARRIVCVSNYDRQLAIQAGIDPDRLITVHNGMPDVPGLPRANPERQDPIRIAMVARFDEQKDHVTLLRAVQPIENVRLDFIGDGPGEPAARQLAEDLGMASRVTFWGRRDNVADILASAQVFALISNWEGFPRSTLEAMRAGLPVVVSDVGGSSEAIVEGVTGFIVPRGDVDIVREKLQWLTANATARANMGREARARYEAEFTFERMYQQTLDVYKACVSSQVAL